eukprot:Rmarinus@m.14970
MNMNRANAIDTTRARPVPAYSKRRLQAKLFRPGLKRSDIQAIMHEHREEEKARAAEAVALREARREERRKLRQLAEGKRACPSQPAPAPETDSKPMPVVSEEISAVLVEKAPLPLPPSPTVVASQDVEQTVLHPKAQPEAAAAAVEDPELAPVGGFWTSFVGMLRSVL